MMVLLGFLVEINKPVGLILFIIMGVISITGLIIHTFILSKKEKSPSGSILISTTTYIFQISPFIIFFLSSDDFIESNKILITISLIFIFTIGYISLMLYYMKYNKISVKTDIELEGIRKNVANEDDYFDSDGKFIGANKRGGK
jgi:hypothetical protein